MKANELRIGSWYNSVKFKKPVQCELSDLYDLCAKSDGAYNDPPIDEMFKPIPLTEEWLKKFWLEKDGDVLGVDTYYNACFIRKNNRVKFIGSYDNSKIGKPIKYVHQLQNLYFALTGKELTIKI